MTVDLQKLFEVLFERFGPNLGVEFEPMSKKEATGATSEVGGIRIVRDRFFLLGEGNRRYEEVEDEIVATGQK